MSRVSDSIGLPRFDECRFPATASIPYRLRSASGESIAKASELPPELISQLKAWVDSPTGTLCLTGNVGCGKSYSAAAMYRAICERRNLPTHIAQWMSCQNAKVVMHYGAQPTGHFEIARNMRFIVLDDLFCVDERRTDQEWQAVIMARYEDPRKVTLITTNLSPKEMWNRGLKRVASRIQAEHNVIEFPDIDLRLEGSL